MTRRYLSLWFPHFPIDRWRRLQGESVTAPLVLIRQGQGGVRLTAADRAALESGLSPGMSLADARALVPELVAIPAAPEADAAALAGLAGWCGRYSPWCAVDGLDGLCLDITGCAHLFAGEAALLDDALTRLGRFGFLACGAVADTPAAAWGWGRYRPGNASPILPPGATDPLATLPVSALGLDAGTVDRLIGFGLATVGLVAALPRAALTVRLGDAVVDRLDRMFGRIAAPISPLTPLRLWRTQRLFAEPIGTRGDIDAATEDLVGRLCRDLASGGQGVRRLELGFYRVDSTLQRIAIGTSRPTQAPAHLLRLFAERLDQVEPGFGIEAMVLDAPVVEPVSADLADLTAADEIDPAALAALVDRLQGRLGPGHVARLVPVESHVPERAEKRVNADSSLPSKTLPPRGGGLGGGAPTLRSLRPKGLVKTPQPRPSPSRGEGDFSALPQNPPPRRGRAGWGGADAFSVAAEMPTDHLRPRPTPSRREGGGREPPLKPARPLRLLPSPEPVDVTAPIPDDPPLSFRWRRAVHRVAAADGPERIGPEWWLRGAPRKTRDYYRVEDSQGRRFWLYREGLYGGDETPRWFLHGFFA